MKKLENIKQQEIENSCTKNLDIAEVAIDSNIGELIAQSRSLGLTIPSIAQSETVAFQLGEENMEILMIGSYRIKFYNSNGLHYADIVPISKEYFSAKTDAKDEITLNAKDKVTVEAKARKWISEQELLQI